MNDDIVFQPGNNNAAPVPLNDNPEAEPESREPKVFDFSSDLNISVVKDEPQKREPIKLPQNPFTSITPLPKKEPAKSYIVEPAPIFAPSLPLSMNPSAPKPAATPPPNLPTVQVAPEPSINKLSTPPAPAPEKEWPFASPATIEKKVAQSPVPNPVNSIQKPPSPIFSPTPTEKPSLSSISAAKPTLSTTGANNTLKNLRTYEGDIAEVMAHRGTSAASVAIAESKRKGEGATLKNLPEKDSVPMPMPPLNRDEPAENHHTGSKLIIILICIILIGAGILVGYYLYSQSPVAKTPATVTTKTRTLPSLIPSDSQIAISIDNTSAANLLSRIKVEMARTQPAGSVKEVVFTETKEGSGYRVSAAEMMALMNVPVPDMIARTLSPQWMLGIYADMDGNKIPFVVVNTNLFQNAFAGMLTWEPSMNQDLKAYISIGSTTPQGSWKDEIVKNKDVRAFVDLLGSTIFEYSFLDNNTLVMTGNNTVMNAIVTRLENKAFVR